MPWSVSYSRRKTIFASVDRLIAAFPLVSTVQNAKSKQTLRLDIDIQTLAAGTLTFTVQSYDDAAGVWVTELVSTALAATGHTILLIDPDSVSVANLTAARMVPIKWRLSVAGATFTTCKFSVTAYLR